MLSHVGSLLEIRFLGCFGHVVNERYQALVTKERAVPYVGLHGLIGGYGFFLFFFSFLYLKSSNGVLRYCLFCDLVNLVVASV
jgi:hypothetical protein